MVALIVPRLAWSTQTEVTAAVAWRKPRRARRVCICLLDLPPELLEKAVALLQLHECGNFARASKVAKAIAAGATGARVTAEVS